jgi:hypothetical protein
MLVERGNYLNQVERGFKYNPIVVLIGARQVGKTSLMKMYRYPGAKLYMHGQHPDAIEIFSHFELTRNKLISKFGEEMDGLLILDEFQYLNNISVIFKLLVDLYPKLKILCSGSSSLDIEQKVEESLAGRVRFVPVYPLSFPEYLDFTNPELAREYEGYSIDNDTVLYDSRLLQHMKDYIIYGGLPKVALTHDVKEKIALLQDIYITYLLRDVKAYIRNEDMVGFNKLLRLLASQIGSELNVNELSITSGLAYKKCEEYLYLLEQMYIIRRLEPILSNRRKEITKMRKVFFYDTGVRNMIYNSFSELDFRIDKGALFENYVFSQILVYMPLTARLNFYRTRDKLEIDFVISQDDKILPIEVKCQSYSNPQKYRTFSDFFDIMDYEEALLVNLDCNGMNNKIRYISGSVFPKYLMNSR